ncbi:hypothetical protein EG68_01220 [Paragonimus skrjabini miyazakii]|uniref:GPCR family 3 nine cysteines domain-containing protein n=1 Tax=Paragonimus skrjabini miyazakii TaxID=59628 RepID=A0A8S9Z8R7_9TREM|nr:hypothetical protein EG68_01220 [Paragonimus skrjabini miyazakii]
MSWKELQIFEMQFDIYNTEVRFDDNGDGYGQYSIYNYAWIPQTSQYDYRAVGDYQGEKLTMRARPIWPGGQSSRLPVSQCSEECGFAEIRRLDKKQQCCWSCEPCAENQRVVNVTHCETCEFQHWPTKNRTSCELLEFFLEVANGYPPFGELLEPNKGQRLLSSG